MTVVTRYLADEAPPELIEHCDRLSLFSSLGFNDLWSASGGRTVYWCAGPEGATEAVLPGVEFGSGMLGRFQATPDGCYARLMLLSNAPDQLRRYGRAILVALARENYVKAFVQDYHGQFPKVDEFERDDVEIQLVDIPSPEWTPLDRRLQLNLRKACKEGVTAVQFDRRRHMRAFLSLVDATEARHGRSRKYPDAFYVRLAELAERDDRVQWMVVEQGDRLAASHTYLVDREMALYWLPYFDPAFSSLKPNVFLIVDTVRRLWSRGVRVLNLGATPTGATGLREFKGRWGGRARTCRNYHRRSWLGRLL